MPSEHAELCYLTRMLWLITLARSRAITRRPPLRLAVLRIRRARVASFLVLTGSSSSPRATCPDNLPQQIACDSTRDPQLSYAENVEAAVTR
jgi:hypothetical protein